MSFLAFGGEGLRALLRERLLNQARFDRLQRRRLTALVRHAATSAPLYRELYAGLDPDRFELGELPTVDKGMLLERFADSVAAERIPLEEARDFAASQTGAGAYLRDRYLLATTGGTTGQVGYFLFERADWARQLGLLFARLLRERLAPQHLFRFVPWRRFRMAFLVATVVPYITFLMASFESAAVRLLTRLRSFSITDDLEETVQALNQFRPHMLHGYTTYVEALAREALEGRLAIAPEIISLGSEPFSALARQVVESAFPRALLRETYGATECVAMANQCRAGRLHVNEDACVLEPVDRDGQPTPPGRLSHHLYVTNLFSAAQPLIRYEISDQIRVLDQPCRCRSPLASIEVVGRSDDTVYLRDPSGHYSSHPPIPFELLFLQVGGVRQYQLIHEHQNALLVRYVAERADDAGALEQRLQRAFAAYLASHGLGEGVELSLLRVDRVERDPRSHKIRQIISQVPPPPAGRDGLVAAEGAS